MQLAGPHKSVGKQVYDQQSNGTSRWKKTIGITGILRYTLIQRCAFCNINIYFVYLGYSVPKLLDEIVKAIL